MQSMMKALAAGAALSAVVLAGAQEKKIARSALPPAVEKAVQVQSGGATVKGFSEEREKGQTFYEAEMIVDGHSKDVLFDGQGNVAEVEEQVVLSSLPADVKAGLEAKAAKGRITKVESITKKGSLVAYEAQIFTNGKRSEVQVGPDGKALAHEE